MPDIDVLAYSWQRHQGLDQFLHHTHSLFIDALHELNADVHLLGDLLQQFPIVDGPPQTGSEFSGHGGSTSSDLTAQSNGESRRDARFFFFFLSVPMLTGADQCLRQMSSSEIHDS